ncbi:phage protein [Vibrio fluvialis]|uniref:phage protein n=1 Tax=Vibrio fluvialis TaxID=676 RepID=UPI0012AD9821|nr:phage protein [Vibrio fluvialis]EKO3405143.1 phage protein [Vibrio fluvialis]EKO3416845.1 phage protein [Vibrio fluvialis]EKO3452664.1 phage protein [Vibrio fluvialis]EKO3499117.1 phage protein [Vibrio fluvialis]ELC0658504.1 phage protein [Vibrio fluvialis]
MHYRKMTKNYIFRKFECELSKEETAKLCFKSVRTVTGWDCGKEIPPECKRLMRWSKRRKLSHHPEWEGFAMADHLLLLPTGQKATAQQILTGLALLEIQSEIELKTCTKLLKIARVLARLKAS